MAGGASRGVRARRIASWRSGGEQSAPAAWGVDTELGGLLGIGSPFVENSCQIWVQWTLRTSCRSRSTRADGWENLRTHKRHGEVTHIPRCTEIRHFANTYAKNFVKGGISKIDILLSSHGCWFVKIDVNGKNKSVLKKCWRWWWVYSLLFQMYEVPRMFEKIMTYFEPDVNRPLNCRNRHPYFFLSRSIFVSLV